MTDEPAPSDAATSPPSADDADRDWEDVPEDPDPNRDLGYELLDLDLVNVENRSEEYVVVMPPDEEMLWDEELIIAMEDDLVDPTERR